MSIFAPGTQSGQVTSTDQLNHHVADFDAPSPPTRHPPGKRLMGGHGARRVKHAADRVLAVLLLLVLAPLLLTITIAVLLSSPGPVFFGHERIGANGKPFRMWKFRSMKANAAEQLTDLLRVHNRGDEPLFKIPDDPRITRLGKWLRRWSLDELPQLWNVAIGEMSLVGPRPQIDAEVLLYTPNDYGRLSVRPGITGLWQVSGRSRLSWKEAIHLDLHYVDNWSLLLDVRILARTVSAVLGGRGAG
ncbi:sugar transferase [Actinoallomurus liliacearum]